MNLRFDPVHCKGDQADTILRIKTFHRFHQAHVAFLNQIGLRQAVTGITTGNMDHEAQMRKNQLAGGIHITFVMQSL